MFFRSAEIEEDLMCAYCKKKFIDVVKIVPSCGESICGDCYEELREGMGESFTFKCQACKKSHKMSEDGFIDNRSLSRMLKRQKIDKPLTEEAAKLKRIVKELEAQVRGLQSFDEQDYIHHHCDQLEVEVIEEIDSLVKQLNEIEEDLLKQIREYRKQCLDAMTTRSTKRSQANKQDQTCESIDVREEINKFKARWNEYFNQADVIVKNIDIDNALKEAKDLEIRLHSLERALKTNALDGQILSFKANHSLIGGLDPLRRCFVLSAQKKDFSIQPTPTRMLTAHSDCVQRVVFLSNDKIASASKDKTIKVWDVNDGTMLFELEGHEGGVFSLVLLSNGWLASGSSDMTVKLWDLDKRSEIRTLSGHSSGIASLQVLSNGNLASYSTDDTIKIWNPYSVENNLLRTMTGHGNMNYLLPFGVLSNDNLVTASTDKENKEECILRVWNPNDGQLVKSIPTSFTDLWTLLVLSNDQVALGFNDGSIKIIDLEDDANSRTKLQAHEGAVSSLAQLSNGYLISSGANKDRTINTWKLPAFSKLQTINYDHTSLIESMRISPNEELLASCSRDKTIKLWPILSK